jgi:precorrin-6B C5,15-methyltransferase / cobalt-precorrin-6B C5,C15-methyltransferase
LMAIRLSLVHNRVAVVGMHGGEVFGAAARLALAQADLLVGSDRHLAYVENPVAERWELHGALKPFLERIATAADQGRRVCMLASGDPGFFGIVRALAARIGAERLAIHPAPTSVAMALARLGMSWDDVVVVSAHGRPLEDAVAEIQRCGRAAVLTAPATPPEAVGALLLAAGQPYDVAVCSRLGSSDELITRTDLAGLATGSFDGLSVTVLTRIAPSSQPTLRWGRPVSVFDHRAGMITKPEVRIVALARLDLPSSGVLWDIGAGSGSIAVEAAALAPGLQVIAIEQNEDDAMRVRVNAERLNVTCEVVVGSAPEVLASLPDPDRIFVGGGGIDVLDAALLRLRPNGMVVATYAAIDRAVLAHQRLGHLTQIAVSNASSLPGAGGLRLVADNPVFLAWGTPT